MSLKNLNFSCQPAQCYKTPFTYTDGSYYWTAGKISDCREWFGNNTGILTVYYETLDVKVLEETVAYAVLYLTKKYMKNCIW